jgi:hypothetical protein
MWLPPKRECSTESAVVRELEDIFGVAYTWTWCTLIAFVTQSHADQLILSLVRVLSTPDVSQAYLWLICCGWWEPPKKITCLFMECMLGETGAILSIKAMSNAPDISQAYPCIYCACGNFCILITNICTLRPSILHSIYIALTPRLELEVISVSKRKNYNTYILRYLVLFICII